MFKPNPIAGLKFTEQKFKLKVIVCKLHDNNFQKKTFCQFGLNFFSQIQKQTLLNEFSFELQWEDL